MNVMLGSNVINNCDSALVVNGMEVFRFREGQSDGQLICDFEVSDTSGNRLAKIAKNQVVHVAEGYEYLATANHAEVLSPNGSSIASVQRVDKQTLKLAGTFHVNGHTVVITEHSLKSDEIAMAGNIISGFGKAISIEPGSFSIGSR